jgi:hypothetical protein
VSETSRPVATATGAAGVGTACEKARLPPGWTVALYFAWADGLRAEGDGETTETMAATSATTTERVITIGSA